MQRSLGLIGIAMLVASSAVAAERMSPPAATSDPDAYRGSSWAATEPPFARVHVGDPAPGFSYLGSDGDWHRFRTLWADGPVLLLFGAREDVLREVELTRTVFTDLGVRPIAVLDMRLGSASRLVRRLSIRTGVIVDPQCVIAGLFSSLDPLTQRHEPSYFIVDERGTVRGLGRAGLPPVRQLVAISARSLGRPLPESAQALSNR